MKSDYTTLMSSGIFSKYKRKTLNIPEGTNAVICPHNEISKLDIPEGVNKIVCSNNQLTELILPEGVETVRCSGNNITHLDLPESVIYLCADKEVLGLERYVGKVDMELL